MVKGEAPRYPRSSTDPPLVFFFFSSELLTHGSFLFRPQHHKRAARTRSTTPAASAMTARAFLGLSDELRESFAKAQDDETLRYLQVNIAGEDTLTTVGSKQRGGDLATDFDGLSQVRQYPAGYSSRVEPRRFTGIPSNVCL